MKTFNEYYIEKQQPEIVDLLSDLVIESFLNLNEDIASMPLHAAIENQVKDSVNAWIKKMCSGTSKTVWGELSKVCSLKYSKPEEKIKLINDVVNKVREKLELSDIEDPSEKDIKSLAVKALVNVKQKGAYGVTKRGLQGAQRMGLDPEVLDTKYKDKRGRPQPLDHGLTFGQDAIGGLGSLSRTPGNSRHDELKRLVPLIRRRYRKGIEEGEFENQSQKHMADTIGKEFEVSGDHILNVLQREGERAKGATATKIRKGLAGRSKNVAEILTRNMRQEIHKLRDQGLEMRMIAKKLHLDRDAVASMWDQRYAPKQQADQD